MKDISQEKKLADFASKHTKEEFRLLVVFKTIKLIVQQELERRKISFDEDVLNEVCIQKANEILPVGRDLSAEELAELIKTIRAKTVKKYTSKFAQDH